MHVGVAGPASLDLLQDLVPDELPGATEFPQTSLLVREFVRRGHTVSLYTHSPHVERLVAFEGEALRVHVGRYRDRHRARDVFATEIGDLRSAMLDDPPEVMSAHWTYEFAIAALSTHVRTFVTVRDWAPTVLRFQPSGYRLVRLLMALRVFADRKATFIALSPYIGELVRRWTRRESVVIPNGMERSAFQADPLPFEERAANVVSIANGFGRRKNAKALIRAWSEVHHALPEHRLALVGWQYGPGEAAQRWASSQGLTDGVEFLGLRPYEETQEIVASAQMLAHPSLEESFGRTLIEAGARGTPALGGHQAGAVPWVLAGGDAGILVDVRSPAAIGAGIEQALTDRDRWQELSTAGRRNAFERFSIQRVAERYLETLGAEG